MKLIIDDANLDTIKGLYEYFPVDGVTTNPTILAKEGKNPYEVLMAIREFIGPDAELHVQVVGKNADLIYEEAHMIRKRLGNNTFIKVPVTREGLKAIKVLKKNGFPVTATAIYTHMQAFLAGKAGADYAAPYVNRIDNLGVDRDSRSKRDPRYFPQQQYGDGGAGRQFQELAAGARTGQTRGRSRHDLARCDRRPCCH